MGEKPAPSKGKPRGDKKPAGKKPAKGKSGKSTRPGKAKPKKSSAGSEKPRRKKRD